MAITITKTIKPSGGDYTSLSAWEAGMQKDLVTADEISVAECYSMEDTTAVTIDGWTTDATRYVKIYTPTAERHGGKWNTGKYRLVTTGAWVGGLYLLEDNVRMDGLQVEATGTGEQNMGIRLVGGGVFWISNCILRSTGAEPEAGLYLLGITSGATVHLRNTVLYDWRYGLYFDSYGTVINGTIYNNTILHCTKVTNPHGIYIANSAAGNNLRFKNNICNGNTTDYFIQDPEETSNNISEDATSPDTAYRNKAVTFIDEVNDDFHIAASDTNAKDAGVDLSADTYFPFSDDIDGETRSGTWDIGADEYVAAGGGGNPVLQPLFLNAGFQAVIAQ